jgi:hypothetical protein
MLTLVLFYKQRLDGRVVFTRCGTLVSVVGSLGRVGSDTSARSRLIGPYFSNAFLSCNVLAGTNLLLQIQYEYPLFSRSVEG